MSCELVVDLSGNHLGEEWRLQSLIAAAARSGAHAVKLQTFDPERMADADTKLTAGPWAGSNLRELYRLTHTPKEWHADAFAKARDFGIPIFSTPFHPLDVAFLEQLGCYRYKTSSFDILNHALHRSIIATGKPVVISTGASSIDEIRSTLEIYPDDYDITLLICTSAYPTDPHECKVRFLPLMKTMFPKAKKVGLSDHSLTRAIPITAAALGADMVEVHLTLSRRDHGPDAGFSFEPHELEELVEDICIVNALPMSVLGRTASELAHLPARRVSA